MNHHGPPGKDGEPPESDQGRLELIEALHRRYGGNTGFASMGLRFRYLRKKYAWILVVSSTRVFKRFLDLSVTLLLTPLLIPLCCLTALCVVVTSGTPVLLRQKRIGKWGREFDCIKFRTMVTGAENLGRSLVRLNDLGNESITFKMKRDPRVTGAGRFLRKYSLDELPQFWNVIKGDMSLVGPRPPLPSEVGAYSLADRRRLDAVPGLTCIWQVSGRGDIPFGRQLELDVEYIESKSIRTDMKILLRTVPAVITGRGAY